MTEGNQEIELPVLDPVPMESFNYSLINTAIGFRMEITFENPSIMGLSKYELSNISVSQGDHYEQNLKMNILFPHIEVSDSEDMNKEKQFCKHFFPVNISGQRIV